MSACPNKSLQDWNDLVDKLGVNKAYFTFIKNGNTVPYLQNRESNRFVWDVENNYKLITWSKVGNVNVKKYKGFDRDTTQKLIEEIRNTYVGEYSIKRIAPDDHGEFGIKITGMPLLKTEYEQFEQEISDDKKNTASAYENFKLYKEFKLREEEANEHILPIDSDLDIYNDQEQRISTKETPDIKQQIEVLSKVMPYIKNIVEDRSIDSIAMLEAGGETIRVNPDKLKSDTLGHEYGHLLIDLRGGLSDLFIQQGIEQLKGSKLWVKVQNAYTELIGTDQLGKEVLAQAIGEEVASIFEDDATQNKFSSWLLRLFKWLSTRVGITKSNAKELARQLTGKEKLDETKLIYNSVNYIQEQRETIQDNKPETIVNAIKNLSNQFTFVKEGHKYLFGTEEFKPVSTLMNEFGYGIKKEDENDRIIRAQKIGTTIHANAESISNGVETIVEANTGYELTVKAHDSLKNILHTTFGEKYTLLNEVVIGDPIAKIAGTADTIAIDNDGNVHIFDYKTATADKGGFKYYNKGYQGARSKREVNTMQLSLYKEILTKTLGIKVKSLNIIPLVVDVNKFDKITNISLDYTLAEDGIVKLDYMKDARKMYRTQIITAKKETGKIDENDISDADIKSRQEALITTKLELSTLSELEQLRERAEDIMSTSLRTMRHKGNEAVQKHLQTVYEDIIKADTVENALMQFTTNTITYINSAYEEYLKLKEDEKNGNKNAFSITRIGNWHTNFAAYDILDDISKYLMDKGNLKDGSTTFKMVNAINFAINKKNVLRDLYKTKGEELITDTLTRYSTNLIIERRENLKREWLTLPKDKQKEISMDDYAENYLKVNMEDIITQTKALIKKEMQVASSDINYLQRWLDTILDTSDVLMAATIKRIIIADRKAREKSNWFKINLVNTLRELENKFDYSHYAGKIESLYDFMLEKNKDGKYSGSIVSKFSSELMDEYNTILKQTETLDRNTRTLKRNEWKEENMPLDKQARAEAFSIFVNGLVDNGTMSEDELSLYWANEELPFKFKSNLIKIINSEAANAIEQWNSVNSFTFRNPSRKWVNRQWFDLQTILKDENDPRTKMYNLIKTMLDELDRELPFNKRLYNKLPYVTKSMLEQFQSGKTAKEIVEEGFAKTFKKHSDDIEKGEITDAQGNPIDFIPVHYNRTDSFDPEKQSYDLSTIYWLWNRMANNYVEKSEVQPEAELVKVIAENRQYMVLDSKGNPINKIMDYAKSKELTKSGSKALIVDQYSDFLSMVLYGKTKVDEGDINVFGYKIDKAKALDSIGKYSAYNLLGLNVIQGISNVNYGELQQIIEGAVGEYFTLGDLKTATNEYTKQLIGNNSILSDIGERVKHNKINALNEMFDVLNEYEGGEFRRNSKFSNLMLSDALFFTAHAGEHFMQSRAMMALLMRVKAIDKTGNVIGNMYEMYDIEKDKNGNPTGKLILDSRVDLDKSNWDNEQQILFGEKAKRVLARIHGEYSILGKSAIQKYALGRLGIMFRKFIVPGIKKRWEKKKVNELLGDYTEGSYREFGLYIKKLAESVKAMQISIANDHWDQLLPREKANIKRAIAEVMAMTMFAVLGTIFLNLKGDDDDDDVYKRMLGIAAFTAFRSKSELAFYFNPVEAMNILRSPAASISMLENIIKMLSSMLPPDFDGFDIYERGSWKGSYKITKKAVNLLPAYRQYYRVRDVEDLLNML